MTRFYVNELTNELEAVPNSTEYSHLKMIQRGFEEVSLMYFTQYMDDHF